jgi:hypothetical protein
MSAETVLYSTLTAAAAVTALVGSGSAARIYPDEIPQEVDVPAVVFFRLSTEYTRTIHAATAVRESATLDVYCLAETRAGAEDLADKVKVATEAAKFITLDRRGDADAGEAIYATVLTVVHTTSS